MISSPSDSPVISLSGEVWLVEIRKGSPPARAIYVTGVDLSTLTHFQQPWPTFQGHRPIFVRKTENFKSI